MMTAPAMLAPSIGATSTTNDRRLQFERLREEIARRNASFRADELQRQPTGIAAVDQLLGGGFLRGQVTALCGEAGAGASTLMARTLAQVTKEGQLGAWVTVGDAPEGGLSAPALELAGVVLPRLMVVKASAKDSLWAAQLLVRTNALKFVVVEVAPGATEVPGAIHRLVDAARAGKDTAVVVLTRSVAVQGCAAVVRMETTTPRLSMPRQVRVALQRSGGGERECLVSMELPRPAPRDVWRPDEQRRSLLRRGGAAVRAGSLPTAPLFAVRQRPSRRAV